MQQNASLNASAGSLCSAAIYILSNVIISVPALYGAAKERCSKIQVHPLSRILCREIESSVQNLLSVVGAHIISLYLVWVSAGKPCKRFCGIIFIPVVCSKKVCYALLLPGAVNLPVQTSANAPFGRDFILCRAYQTCLGVPCHIFGNNVLRRTIGITVI